jgi:hypothetical protein
VSVLEKVRQLNPFTTLLAPLAIFLQIISSGRGRPLFFNYVWLLVASCGLFFVSLNFFRSLACMEFLPVEKTVPCELRSVRFGFNLEYVV